MSSDFTGKKIGLDTPEAVEGKFDAFQSFPRKAERRG